MEIFWFLFAYMLIIAFIFRGKSISDKKRMHETICMCIPIFLILALRSPACGIDLIHEEGSGNGYYTDFPIIAKSRWSEIFTSNYFHRNYEIGYLVYNKLVSYVSSNPQFFLAITALVSVGSIGYVIYKYSSNIFLSFLIYICLGQYVFSFSALRQTMAISLSLLGVRFLLERKSWHYLFILLLTLSFHTSSIVLFAAWPFCRKKLTNSTLIIMLLLVIASIPALKILLSFVLSVIGFYSLSITEGSAVTMFFVYFALLAVSLIIKPDYKGNQDKEKTFSFYRWVILFAVFGQSLGFIDSGWLTRIGFYFSIYFCLFLPELFYGIGKNFRSILYPIIVVLFILFFYLTTKDGYLDVVPYHFFWEYWNLDLYWTA